MKKALIIANTASMIHLFNEKNISLLMSQGYEIHIACNFKDGNTISDKAINECCDDWRSRGIICHHIDFLRTPFSLKSIEIYKYVKKLIRTNGFDIIHCHTPIVSIFVRMAARKLRKTGTHVIYTAHGFHFFKGAPLKNWLIYYPAEWFCSFFTDVLITINEEDFKRAKRRFHAKSTEHIPGIGIDYLSIRDIKPDKKQKLSEFSVGDEPVLLSVGELNDNKNHAVILKALSRIEKPYKYIICGRGDNAAALKELAEALGIADKVVIAGYRSDVKELLACSDIFCFPSFREGLSVAVMEAMASGLAVVASDIRGNTDLIEDNKGGFLYAPDDTEGFAEGIEKLIEDSELRGQFGEYNLERIEEFSVAIVSDKLASLYFDGSGVVLKNETVAV